MITVGLDPGTKATAQVVLDGDILKIVHVVTQVSVGRHAILNIIKKLPPLTRADRAAAEFPQSYEQGAVNPNRLFCLAAISGAAMTRIVAPQKKFVLPREWKGNLPKGINQKQTCRRLALPFADKGRTSTPQVGVVSGVPFFLNGERVESKGIPEWAWSDVLDAAGIALWAQTRKFNRS